MAWRGARLGFLAQSHSAQIVVFDDWRRFTSRFLVALLRVKTVNLAEIATGFRTNVQTFSNAGRSAHRRASAALFLLI